MKKISILILAVLLGSTTVFGQGIEFRNIAFNEAKTQAKSEEKLILIDCYTSWCGPCKMMDKNEFPRKEMGDYFNPRFVSVKYDMEKGEGPELKKQFGVKAYPTFIILDGDGKVLHRFEGMKPSYAFIQEVKGALDESMSLETMGKLYDEGKRDKGFLFDYAMAMLGQRDYARSSEVAGEFMKQLNDEEKISPQYWIMYEQYAPLGSENEKYLLANLPRFKNSMGQEKIAEFLKNKYAGELSGLLFNPRDEKRDEKLAMIKERVKSLKLDKEPLVSLYIKTVDARFENSVGKFLKAFKKESGLLTNGDLGHFVKMACVSYSGLFNKEQKEQFKGMVKDEAMKEEIDKFLF